jgi:hypothetical protein
LPNRLRSVIILRTRSTREVAGRSYPVDLRSSP